jgi:hypothetical protein
VREVEVWLNGRLLVVGHAHAPADARSGVDEGCVEQDQIARLIGGKKYLEAHGSILEAIALGAGPGASLRVERRGVISTRLHRTGEDFAIPLADFARALGATVVREAPGRVRLVLAPRSRRVRALLGPND